MKAKDEIRDHRRMMRLPILDLTVEIPASGDERVALMESAYRLSCEYDDARVALADYLCSVAETSFLEQDIIECDLEAIQERLAEAAEVVRKAESAARWASAVETICRAIVIREIDKRTAARIEDHEKTRADRIASRPDFEPVKMGRICSRCRKKPARIDDLCKKCARESGIIVHGKIT